jgi:hypothetical protein
LNTLDTKLAESDNIIGRPIRPAEDPTLVLDWINWCDTSHKNCEISSPTGATPTFKPTRLVSVGSNASPELRLINGNQCTGSYATLSYCWGKKVDNLTTKSTLNASMIELDISASCKTMHDAIIVTRNLKLEYIWIDALCIIQDDPEDWEREALSMSEIYTHSAITIAATSCADSQGGLFLPRSAGQTAQLPWTTSDSCPPERVSFRSHDPTRYSSLVMEGPLNKRGWVLQERYLSRRTVHFTSDRLFWECRQTTLEEGLTNANSPDWLPMREFHLSSLQEKIKTPADMHRLGDGWRLVIEYYARTQLTYTSDRLPALAGLAKAWAKASNDRYIAGCWQNSIPLHLLWTPPEYEHAASIEPAQRPSWSWVSFGGPVRYHGIWDSSSMVNLLEDIVVTINGSTTANIYVGIQEAFLTLTGRVKATIFNGDLAHQWGQVEFWSMTLDDKDYVYKKAIFDRVPKFNEMVPMLQLCRCENATERAEYVMLLEPLEEHDCFQRIGFGIITQELLQLQEGPLGDGADSQMESWFDDAPSVRIRIY